MKICLKEDIDENIDVMALTEDDYWNDYASGKYEYIDTDSGKFICDSRTLLEITIGDKCINE